MPEKFSETPQGLHSSDRKYGKIQLSSSRLWRPVWAAKAFAEELIFIFKRTLVMRRNRKLSFCSAGFFLLPLSLHGHNFLFLGHSGYPFAGTLSLAVSKKRWGMCCEWSSLVGGNVQFRTVLRQLKRVLSPLIRPVVRKCYKLFESICVGCCCVK